MAVARRRDGARTTRRRMGRAFAAAAAAGLSLTAGLVVAPSAAIAATPVDVTVRITHVTQLQNPDGDGSDGDFYPRVDIAGAGVQTRVAVQDDDFRPDWRITQSVDLAAGVIPIRIELWDEDGGFAGGDDHTDISPLNQDVTVDIQFDMATRTYTSPDLPANATHAEGDGDPNFPDTNDGTRSKINFDIFVGPSPDLDGDGIPDSVERFGVTDADNNVVATLGSSPCRKSIMLEIDWMQGAGDGHTHQPKAAAITEVKGAFAAGPVPATTPCPYSGASTATGVELVVLPGNGVAEAAVTGLDQDFRDLRNANFHPALRPYAHYVVFVHDQAAGTSSSGLCCEGTQGGKDLIVSLGSWHTTCVGPGKDGKLNTSQGGDDPVVGTSLGLGADRTCNSTKVGDDTQDEPVGGGADVNQVGSAREQAGTIMHELGHSIGLGHGGADGVNYKPNYISNENYRFQFGIPFGSTAGSSRLDYSRAALPTLLERTLSEPAGVGDGTDWTAWADGTGKINWSIANTGIDWDQSKSVDAAPKTVAVDLNGDATCVSAGGNGTLDTSVSGDDVADAATMSVTPGPDSRCATLPSGDDVDATVLTGYDDWSNLKYRAVEAAGAGASNARAHPERDITYQQKVAADRQFADFFTPDVEVTKAVDRSVAEGGQLLSYDVGVTDVGPGDATDVVITDTLPDGITATAQVGSLASGASTVRKFSYLVPCSTTDGTVLTNTATATAEDVAGRAEQNTSNNTATASTVIKAPRLTLGTVATSQVLAGGLISYAVDYGNTGSGSASNVVVTDTLPVGTYYSVGLDLGAGPRPTTVTSNPDGTTTLTWAIGTVPAGGSGTLAYTARPSLLMPRTP